MMRDHWQMHDRCRAQTPVRHLGTHDRDAWPSEQALRARLGAFLLTAHMAGTRIHTALTRSTENAASCDWQL